MRINIRGWKARQAAARMRQERIAERMRINAIRRAYYDQLEAAASSQNIVDSEPEEKLAAPKEATPDVAPEAEHNEAADVNQEQAQDASVDEEKPANPEDLSNADLRAALEEKGFEVPKTTARTRLIELYKEHVQKK